MNIIESNNVAEIKSNIRNAGFDKLHILADFDRTLTYGAVDGVKVPSITALLGDGKHLSPDYAAKAHILFEKYGPIEIDTTISKAAKKKAMQEWWEIHFDLLIKSGLTLSDLEDIVQNGQIKFREGMQQLLDVLNKHNIPLVIMSASGSGETIPMYFKKINRDYKNIYYIINRFNWNPAGQAVSTQDPIINSANKDETVLKQFPEIYQVVKNRTNVILLGDNIDDIGMIEGFEYDNLLKIGFLNSDHSKNRQIYTETYDVVLEGDEGIDYVTDLLQ